jgi:hypothetical protein
VDVLTANYDNNCTNANLNEGLLNTNNVNPTQFGKLYAYAVDGQVYAQPLYAHALAMPGKGTLNVLYMATMHNSVYAFDADAVSGTAPLWQVNLAAPSIPLQSACRVRRRTPTFSTKSGFSEHPRSASRATLYMS